MKAARTETETFFQFPSEMLNNCERYTHMQAYNKKFHFKLQFGSDCGLNTQVLEDWNVEFFWGFFPHSEYCMSQGLNTTLRDNRIESEGN